VSCDHKVLADRAPRKGKVTVTKEKEDATGTISIYNFFPQLASTPTDPTQSALAYFVLAEHSKNLAFEATIT
jgi:hypothetical protein